jgi:type IV secretion system protein TrbL
MMTELLNQFGSTFMMGTRYLSMYAKWILATVAAIDFFLGMLLHLGDPDTIKFIIRKILLYGFFIWFVNDYGRIMNWILDGFTFLGLKAGGGAIDMAMISDPSCIAGYGINLCLPITDYFATLKGWDVMFKLHYVIFLELTALVIMASFFIMGLQLFITYLEFTIVGTISMVLIPFGVNEHTKFISEKAIGALVGFGIKLMILAFIACAAIPIAMQWKLNVDPAGNANWGDCANMMMGAITMAFLMIHAPSVAMSLLSGSPTISGGTAMGTAAAAGMGAMAIGRGVLAAGSQMSSGFGSGVNAARIGYKADGLRGAVNAVAENSFKATNFSKGALDASQRLNNYDKPPAPTNNKNET